MINNTIIEICIGNIQDGLIASKYPIDRIELNSALELGGLTPSLETLKYLKEHIKTKICCMVRPRGGDFCYTSEEFEIMLKDAESLLKENTDGIVFGFLNKDKTIDIARTVKMVNLIHSYGKEAIFHKALDEVVDLDDAIQTLVDCHIDRVLTAGKCDPSNIINGCKNINLLVKKYGDRIQFLPGGGVRVNNIQEVLKIAQSGQVHMTSKKNSAGGYLCLDEEQLVQMLNKIAEL